MSRSVICFHTVIVEAYISNQLPPSRESLSLSADLAPPSSMSTFTRDVDREVQDAGTHVPHLQRQLLAALHEMAVLEEQLRAQSAELEAIERRHDAERLEWTRSSEEGMESLHRVLNARVAQRTRELELALNGEQSARREADSGYLEILQQNIHGVLTVDQRRDIERIHQAQDHLLALVNMILDFAKLEGGPVELSMAEIPIEETLRAAEALVAPQFAKKGITYQHRAGDPSITVFADREKVSQIIVNLLANAMKFTAPGGTVGLEWNLEEETLFVRIRDTGSGIPSDKLEQIFEPFVQLRAPGSPPAGGTGLGLPISRDLARAMSGDIRVSSTIGIHAVAPA